MRDRPFLVDGGCAPTVLSLASAEPARTEIAPYSAAPHSSQPHSSQPVQNTGVRQRVPNVATLASDIDAYAKLVVDLFSTPYGADHVLAAYGLADQQLESLHQLWRSHLERDPALNARFRATRARFAQELDLGVVPSIRFG